MINKLSVWSFFKWGPSAASDRWAAQLLPTAFHAIFKMYVTHKHTHTHTHTHACPSLLLAVRQRGRGSRCHAGLFLDRKSFFSISSSASKRHRNRLHEKSRYNRVRTIQSQCGDIKLHPWRATEKINIKYLPTCLNAFKQISKSLKFISIILYYLIIFFVTVWPESDPSGCFFVRLNLNQNEQLILIKTFSLEPPEKDQNQCCHCTQGPVQWNTVLYITRNSSKSAYKNM